MKALSYAAIAIGAAKLDEGVIDVLQYTAGPGRVKSLAEMLQYFRETYGAELMLPADMRDRSAVEFATYLEQRRRGAPDGINVVQGELK
jgi:hypothetical protein